MLHNFQIHFLPNAVASMQKTSGNAAIFVIDDGSQPKIELCSRDRNLIAATFTHFLIKNIGGSETFKDKQDFFYHEVRKFHANYYHEKLSLKVQREKILVSFMFLCFVGLWYNKSSWIDSHCVPLKVKAKLNFSLQESSMKATKNFSGKNIFQHELHHVWKTTIHE